MHLPTQHKRPIRQAGFTIVELLTAVFVTMIMLLLISRIFGDSTAAVSQGLGVSRVLANARTMGDQLGKDFGNLVPPSSDSDADRGVLIIRNQEYDNITYLQPGGGTGTRTVRSDQIVYITSAVGSNLLRPTTPGAPTTFFNPATASFARVWMGHGQVVTNNFTPGTGYSTSPSFVAINTPNNADNICTNWVLARQAMLLVGEDALPGNLSIYANDPRPNAMVSSSPASEVWNGYSDVCAWSLRDLISTNRDGGTNMTEPYLVDEVALTQIPGEGTPQNNTEYGERAATLLFADNARMRVRREALTGAPHRAFSTNEIAQMHPFFLGDCSDFIVEFAGNYDTNSDDPDVDAAGQIKWYFVGLGGTVSQSDTSNTLDVNGSHPFNPPATFYDKDDTSPLPSPSSYFDNTTGTVVFRHNAPNTWPRFLRFRYRLHDPTGTVKDEDGNSGRWFEHIVKLPRR